MRNPNGYGTVVKLSGNRRRPYAVRKTVGFKENGQPIIKAIGYAATREEGLIMLAEFNHKPYNVDIRKMTVKEVFEGWLKRNANNGKLSKSSIQAAKTAWKYCESVYNVKYGDLKVYQMQDCIDNCPHGPGTKKTIKTLFYNLDRYSMELEIIDKKNSELLTTPTQPESNKKPFTKEEIECLWHHKDEPEVDFVLVLIYMGWRISELLDITHDNVDLVNKTIKGGVKTKSGKNRIVPIHERILPLIIKRYNTRAKYLFGTNEYRRSSTPVYYSVWHKTQNKLGMHHTPHECRHTFRTLLDAKGANKVCIDLLMGHKSSSVGERVYTHKTLKELTDTVNSLD